MGWPSGVKLNTQLDYFLGHLFKIYIAHWAVVMDVAGSIAPFVLVPLVLFGGYASGLISFSSFTQIKLDGVRLVWCCLSSIDSHGFEGNCP